MINEEMPEELVSVIIPVYNVEKYLEDCIYSVCQQTYHNLEVILINDGSTDESGRICDNFAKKDDRIKVIHKENGGLSDARNRGIACASGDWMILVDSDDFIHPELVYICLSIARRSKADLVTYEMKQVSENTVYSKYVKCFTEQTALSNKENELKVFSGRNMLYNFLKCGMGDVVAWNKFYKGSLLKNIRYPKGRYHEDEFVIADVYLAAYRVVVTDNVLYYYRKRRSSITNNKNIKNRYDVISAYGNICRKTKFDKQIHEMAIRQYILYHMKLYAHETNIDKRNVIKKSFRSHYAFGLFRNEYWKTQILLLMFWLSPGLLINFYERKLLE